jgi:2-keto-4-pentenoate hydratase/2-oxohepta-3-ene-1,7-dioic acid hydratase in catechol pathway
MRIVRFVSEGGVHIGSQIDDDYALQIDGELFGPHRITDRRLRIEKLLSPLVPTDILCIGLNYREHAKESNSKIPMIPILFIKAGNSLNNPFDPIPVSKRTNQIDFEAELAVVIGKPAKSVRREHALDYVFGYTCANDVSARDWQRDKALGGGQFARGKSFDGFCPLGPCIVTRDEIPDPNDLLIKSTVNGKVMQQSSTADMIFTVATLIESLSSTMTLRPGSVILTGTPSGVGFARTPPVWLKDGDTVVIEVEKIGRLENSMRTEGAEEVVAK